LGKARKNCFSKISAFREDLIKFSKEQKYITYHYENPSTKEVVLKMASSIFIPLLRCDRADVLTGSYS
jgi:hypothetical protein